MKKEKEESRPDSGERHAESRGASDHPMRKLAVTLTSIVAILGIAWLLNFSWKFAVGISVFLLARHFLDIGEQAGGQNRPWWSVNKRIRFLGLAVMVLFAVAIGYGAIVGYE